MRSVPGFAFSGSSSKSEQLHVEGLAYDFKSLIVGWSAILVKLSKSPMTSIVSFWNSSQYFDLVYQQLARDSEGIGGSLTNNVLLVNTPQLGVSLVYVFYNSLLTRMLVAHEYCKFGRVRSSLRVSRPVGDQRSTLWLQLPYRYIIPSMASMALLHWLLSRGIYLINVRVYDIQGLEEPSRIRFAYGTSQVALLFAFLVGTMMLVALFALMFRRLGTGIPIFGTCSVAISAACHVPKGDKSAATKPLMYGVVPLDEHVRPEFRHTTFSSKTVELCKEGIIYK
jgi:hypothetical protein